MGAFANISGLNLGVVQQNPVLLFRCSVSIIQELPGQMLQFCVTKWMAVCR